MKKAMVLIAMAVFGMVLIAGTTVIAKEVFEKCVSCWGSGKCTLCGGNGKGIGENKCGWCNGGGRCKSCNGTGGTWVTK